MLGLNCRNRSLTASQEGVRAQVTGAQGRIKILALVRTKLHWRVQVHPTSRARTKALVPAPSITLNPRKNHYALITVAATHLIHLSLKTQSSPLPQMSAHTP